MTTPTIQENLTAKVNAAFGQAMATYQSFDDAQWQTVVDADSGWTAQDILRHLIPSSIGMIHLAKQIAAGGEGAAADFDLDRWNASQVKKQQGMNSAELLTTFQQTQQAVIDAIQAIPEDGWDKQGNHALIGIVSVKGMFKIIAMHIDGHLAEVKAAQ